MTQTAEPTPDITLKSPADLLSAVPYLLGYVPSDSFVLVGLAQRRIAITACTDLPSPSSPVESLALTAQMLRRNKLEAAIIIGYGRREQVTRCIDYVTAMLHRIDVELVEAMRVTQGRYWSYTCQELDCCPAEGTRLNSHDSAVDAAMTAGGLQAMSSREEVIGQLSPVDEITKKTVASATSKVIDFLNDTQSVVSSQVLLRNETLAILDKLADGSELPDAESTVRLAASLSDPKTRGDALVSVDQRGTSQAVRLWLWVTRHVTAPFRAEPAALLAYAAWRGGNSVLAAEAVRVSLVAEPGNKLAILVEQLLDAAIASSTLPKLKLSDLAS